MSNPYQRSFKYHNRYDVSKRRPRKTLTDKQRERKQLAVKCAQELRNMANFVSDAKKCLTANDPELIKQLAAFQGKPDQYRRPAKPRKTVEAPPCFPRNVVRGGRLKWNRQ